ncbi:hypothetical protein [Geothermobacter hydrogeniphilus]|nr:hypothetical protein [Geothermobacter hydrogeniphilus]
MLPRETSLAMLETVAQQLGSLRDQVVFLGGCTIPLFLTDPGASAIRPTFDVDLIVEVTSAMEFQQLEEKLRQRGFCQDINENIICRWSVAGVMVDIMPTDEKILGFSNTWYKEAIRQAKTCRLTKELTIRLVTPPCFAATKIVAFHNRGKGDFQASHDMEDLITLIDGRPELAEEISLADDRLKTFLSEEIGRFLNDEAFLQALPGHLPPDPASQQRLPMLLDRCAMIANMG